MKKNNSDFFPQEIVDNLKYYVYRLIDPRNGETFYIGKGKEQRIFQHIKEEIINEDITNSKIERIREIKLAGFDVAHVIHRHGLDEKTAFEVEAALIDAYPGLSNVMSGHGNNDFGVMHTDEIITKYAAVEAIFKHKVMMINVNRTALATKLYDATRYAWKINIKKAQKAEFILATQFGLIKDVFVAEKWLEATPENFPTFPLTNEGRFAFIGKDAPIEIKKMYINKRVPNEYRKPGAANPIKYTF